MEPREARALLPRPAELFVVTAVVDEAALLAERIPGPADAAPMTDQVYVNLVVAVLRDHPFHQAVSFFIRAPVWNQVESPGYAKDVDIDGKDRPIAGEEQGAGNCLGSYAVEARKKLFGFVKGCSGKE